MPEHPVLESAQKFRAAALSRERQAAGRLVQTYGRAYTRLSPAIEALSQRIARMDAPGPSRASLTRLDSLRSLRSQVEEEIARFAAYADTEISRGATEAIAAGLKDSRAMAAASMGTSGPGQRALITAWDMLPTESVETMLGFLADDSPLHTALTKRLGPAVAQRMSDALVDGIVLGMNPRKVAEIVRRELGVGLSWALTTARTAQLYAYREATRANYMANSHIVSGWTWLSALDARTCMSCINQHGSVHPVSEALNDHHNGRCLLPGQMVVTLRGDVPIESIVIGDYVLTHKGRYQKVTATSETPYNGDVYSISQSSQYSVSVTSEHPVMTENRGWVEAKDCTAWDTFSTLCDVLVRASSLNTVQPVDSKSESLLLSRAIRDFVLCHPGSNSTANRSVGKAKSMLYDPTANWGTQYNPESQIALSNVNSPSVENVFQFRIRVMASDLARFFCDSGVRIRDKASGFFDIWRKAASLEEIGSTLLSFIQRMSVRVLMSSSAQISRYDAPSSWYLRSSHAFSGSPNLASILLSNEAEYSFPQSDMSLFSPSVFVRCKTALCVLPGNRATISICSVVSKFAKMIASSDFVHLLRAISTPIDDDLHNGNIVHHPSGIVKKSTYSGMVYNLQVMEDESYIAGGIVVHNCVAIPNVRQAAALGLPQADIEPGEQWFGRQPEAMQRQMMGPGMYDAWKAGKVAFGDLSQPYQDPVYGEMLREASLVGLLGEEAKKYYRQQKATR